MGEIMARLNTHYDEVSLHVLYSYDINVERATLKRRLVTKLKRPCHKNKATMWSFFDYEYTKMSYRASR